MASTKTGTKTARTARAAQAVGRAVRRQWTLEERRERSLALVCERGYFGWGPACTVSTELSSDGRRLISLTVRVPSASQADVWHVLTYDRARDDAECDCLSAQHGAPCFHRGCAVNAGRYVARLARRGWPED